MPVPVIGEAALKLVPLAGEAGIRHGRTGNLAEGQPAIRDDGLVLVRQVRVGQRALILRRMQDKQSQAARLCFFQRVTATSAQQTK